MLVLLSLVIVGLSLAGAWWAHRHWRAWSLNRQLRTVQVTSELWRQVKVLPAPVLSRPLRDAIACALTQAARRLEDGPFRTFVGTLDAQARDIRAYGQTGGATGVPTNIRRLLENLRSQLARAAALGLLPAREEALANSAIHLATELINVDILVQEARRARVLRDEGRSEQLKEQALAWCARLPAKTAEETRRRVEADLAA